MYKSKAEVEREWYKEEKKKGVQCGDATVCGGQAGEESRKVDLMSGGDEDQAI